MGVHRIEHLPHGGDDPGKIGINGAKEKEINLAIAKKLQSLLEAEGFAVVMTRESDEGLYEESSESKKQQDMKKRCEKINKANPLCTVSIHQNSYQDGIVQGPQVFYYSHSDEGQKLAAAIQKSLNEGLKVARERAIKENNSYYILRKTKSPIVIAECGFLSNQREAELLVSEEYQTKVAEALKNGVISYTEALQK